MRQRVLLALVVLGATVPYTALAVFVSRHGLDIDLRVRQVFASPGSTFFALDVVMSAVALLLAVALNAGPVRRRWLVVSVTVIVGPSCGLPLWLLLRSQNDL